MERTNASDEPATGILWTNTVRTKACSEFDALVIQLCANNLTKDEVEAEEVVEGVASCSDNNTVQIVEVWEAKFTLNPSTLRDAITKKLPAIKSILNDTNSSLLHAGSEYRLTNNDEEKGPFPIDIWDVWVRDTSSRQCRLAGVAQYGD